MLYIRANLLALMEWSTVVSKHSPVRLRFVNENYWGLALSQRFIGKYGEVVINPQTGQIISVNPTSSSKAAILLKQLGQ